MVSEYKARAAFLRFACLRVRMVFSPYIGSNEYIQHCSSVAQPQLPVLNGDSPSLNIRMKYPDATSNVDETG